MQTNHATTPPTICAPHSQHSLTIHAGNQTHTVQQDQVPLVIGRDPAAQVCIEDERISWVHLRLEHTSTGWVAIDESRNGIFLDGTRQPQIPINDTTTIHLGHPHGIPVTFTEDTSAPQQPPDNNTDNDDESIVLGTTDPGVARAGAAVAARRKELDLSQRYLASNGIMNAGSLIDFEKGRRWPRRATRARLEEALHWPPGHIASLRNQRLDPHDEQTMSLTTTMRIPLMTDVVEAALDNITTTIESLPAVSDPEYTARANPILAGLRRIEGSAARAAHAAAGDTSVALILGAVRKTYKDLMLRAARAPGATLGQQLFAARHRVDLSVEEIANAAGVPVEAITAVEAEAALDAGTTAALAAALNALAPPGRAGP
jgi:transcriptional regulator with XRE-family HTH domain/DNA-binding XRE family transcriptional regulator